MKQKSILILAACSVILTGCVSSSPVRQHSGSIYDSNAGKNISLTNIDALTEILHNKGSLESERDYASRVAAFFKKYESTPVFLDAKGYDYFRSASLFDKVKDIDGMAAYRLAGSDKGNCWEFEDGGRNQYSGTIHRKLCKISGSQTEKIITISSSDASRINDINNIRIAIQGNLSPPYVTRENWGSKVSRITYTYYMSNPLLVLYDRRNMQVIGVMDF